MALQQVDHRVSGRGAASNRSYDNSCIPTAVPAVGVISPITRIDRSWPPVESVGVRWADNESFALRLGLLQKDDIGICVAPQNTKTAAIRRPVERKDLLSVEVSNLTPGRTVHWLNPDVVHAILANAVSDCISICCKLRSCGDSRIYIQ